VNVFVSEGTGEHWLWESMHTKFVWLQILLISLILIHAQDYKKVS